MPDAPYDLAIDSGGDALPLSGPPPPLSWKPPSGAAGPRGGPGGGTPPPRVVGAPAGGGGGRGGVRGGAPRGGGGAPRRDHRRGRAALLPLAVGGAGQRAPGGLAGPGTRHRRRLAVVAVAHVRERSARR